MISTRLRRETHLRTAFVGDVNIITKEPRAKVITQESRVTKALNGTVHITCVA